MSLQDTVWSYYVATVLVMSLQDTVWSYYVATVLVMSLQDTVWSYYVAGSRYDLAGYSLVL